MCDCFCLYCAIHVDNISLIPVLSAQWNRLGTQMYTELLASFPGLQSQLMWWKAFLRRMTSGGRMEDIWRGGISVKPRTQEVTSDCSVWLLNACTSGLTEVRHLQTSSTYPHVHLISFYVGFLPGLPLQ